MTLPRNQTYDSRPSTAANDLQNKYKLKQQNNEKTVSTKQDKKKTQPWFQGKNENQGGQGRYQVQACKRQKKTNRIIEKSAVIQRENVFSKIHRLNRPAQFKKAFGSACRSNDNYMLVVANKNNKGIARLGLAISRRNIKSAARRNQVKRIIRESFRANKNKLEKLDIVVKAHNDADGAKKKTLSESLSRHWQNITECKKY